MSSNLSLYICLILLCQCDGQRQRRRQKQRNSTRTSTGLSPELQQAYINAVVERHDSTSSTPGLTTEPTQFVDSVAAQDLTTTADMNIWHAYIPNTPAPNEVECFVEVVTVRRQGGRCTRLGGVSRPYICQSGPHFEFFPACKETLTRKAKQAP